MEKILVLVFSHPLLTSAIVGVLIHSTLAFNYSMMLYVTYLQKNYLTLTF